MLAFATSPDTKPADLAGHRLTRCNVNYASFYYVSWHLSLVILLVIDSLGEMWTMLAFATSPDTKPADLAGHRLTRCNVNYASFYFVSWHLS